MKRSSVRARVLFSALASLLLGAGCSASSRGSGAAKAGPPAPGGPAAAVPSAEVVDAVKPARLLPDLVGVRGVVAHEDGVSRVLIDRMRLLVRDDGSIERADELMPIAGVSSVALPSRLGGGFLFHAPVREKSGTQIWRAPTWLAKLRPLVMLGGTVNEVFAGFDRLYVRGTNVAMGALNAETGEQMSLGPLPVAAAYGQLAFADGWRAVVDADLRGPLATFDAGASWRPVLTGGVNDKAQGLGVVDGNPAIFTSTGRYIVDARGNVTFRRNEALKELAAGWAEGQATSAAHVGPLGKRPLRAAVEDGWPDSPTTAIVARGGVLARVSLRDGAVLATAEEAYPERLADCHAIRVGKGAGFGFVCGEREAGTVVYAFVPPLSLKPVVRFSTPRFISPSGNGALVIRGGCADEPDAAKAGLWAPTQVAPNAPIVAPTEDVFADVGLKGAASAAASASASASAAPPPPPPPVDDLRAYCVVAADGSTREIRVKGEPGAERVVALSDGAIVILVPPRGDTGQLKILRGASATSVALKLPTTPRGAARELRRGMWLEGFEEREPNVLSGWVEAGGPVAGLSIALDGTVTTGELRDDGAAVVAGRFGFAYSDAGHAAETSDGGRTWTELDLPDREAESAKSGATRACGPAGCVLPGWIRVGWGKPPEDEELRPAEAPSPQYAPLRMSSALVLECELGASATPPLPPPKEKVAKGRPSATPVPVVRGYPPPGYGGYGGYGGLGGYGAPLGAAQLNTTGWDTFRNTPPPALADDEVGFGNGETSTVYAYAWGKRGADWTRAGRFRVRFDDRFDAGGGVRSTATIASPWPDAETAAPAIGMRNGYSPSWSAFLDPGGHAALVSAGPNTFGALYAAADGQPALPIRDIYGRTGVMNRPVEGGAVRVGETWFYLATGSGYGAEPLNVLRVDLGVARTLGTYYRPMRSGMEAPRLVRRAFGAGVGILISAAPDPAERSGRWYVLPLDPENGALGEPIALVRRDLGGVTLARCAAGQDGWMLDVRPEDPSSVEIPGGAAAFSGLELRLRADPGSACVDAMAARAEGLSEKPAPKGVVRRAPAPKPAAVKPSGAAKPDDPDALPLAASETSTGKRWALRCHRRGG